jgi:hypothetical protein
MFDAGGEERGTIYTELKEANFHTGEIMLFLMHEW